MATSRPNVRPSSIHSLNRALAGAYAAALVTSAGCGSAPVAVQPQAAPAQVSSASAPKVTKCADEISDPSRTAARTAMLEQLTAEGHSQAELGEMRWFGGLVVGRVREAPGAPWGWRQASFLLSHDLDKPDRWILQPSAHDDHLLFDLAARVASQAPSDLEVDLLLLRRVSPTELVLVPTFIARNGPANRFHAAAIEFHLDSSSEAAKPTWIQNRTVHEALELGNLRGQRALARHLNEESYLLVDWDDVPTADPRGRLYSIMRRSCAARPPSESDSRLLLVTNPNEAPARWSIQDVAITPKEHEERVAAAREAAVLQAVETNGEKLVMHDKTRQIIVATGADGSIRTTSYALSPRSDAPREPAGWEVAWKPLSNADGYATIHNVLVHHFGNARLRSWGPTRGALFEEPCSAANQCSTEADIWVHVESSAGGLNAGVVRIARQPAANPFEVKSWSTKVLAELKPRAPAHD